MATKPATDEWGGIKLPELRDFTFRIRGHGQDIPAGTFRAEDEQRAFTQAFKGCKHFGLPGWTLYCVETKTSLPAVKLSGDRDPQELMPYEAKKGRKITKRV